MTDVNVQIQKIYPEVEIPTYATAGSSGFDFKSYLKFYLSDFEMFASKFAKVRNEDYRIILVEEKLVQIELLPFKSIPIPTGLKLAIPDSLEMQVRPRSGLSIKQGLVLTNTPGTVDSDYRGEIILLMKNSTEKSIIISHNERLAQGVIVPVFQAKFIEVPSLDETIRGEGGFGHTGKS